MSVLFPLKEMGRPEGADSKVRDTSDTFMLVLGI